MLTADVLCATCGQVVDFKLFEKGKALRPNTLWVVEEIPGLVEGADQTATLARGYWPSCARIRLLAVLWMSRSLVLSSFRQRAVLRGGLQPIRLQDDLRQ